MVSGQPYFSLLPSTLSTGSPAHATTGNGATLNRWMGYKAAFNSQGQQKQESALPHYQDLLGSNLELASLSHVFYPLEGLVLLPIHVQAIHLES